MKHIAALILLVACVFAAGSAIASGCDIDPRSCRPF